MSFIHYPKETLPFLRSIQLNNNKEWFEAHKDEYTKFILESQRADSVSLPSDHQCHSQDQPIPFSHLPRHPLFKRQDTYQRQGRYYLLGRQTYPYAVELLLSSVLAQ
jgi:uncharacterized protein (DUF2461 family)